MRAGHHRDAQFGEALLEQEVLLIGRQADAADERPAVEQRGAAIAIEVGLADPGEIGEGASQLVGPAFKVAENRRGQDQAHPPPVRTEFGRLGERLGKDQPGIGRTFNHQGGLSTPARIIEAVDPQAAAGPQAQDGGGIPFGQRQTRDQLAARGFDGAPAIGSGLDRGAQGGAIDPQFAGREGRGVAPGPDQGGIGKAGEQVGAQFGTVGAGQQFFDPADRLVSSLGIQAAQPHQAGGDLGAIPGSALAVVVEDREVGRRALVAGDPVAAAAALAGITVTGIGDRGRIVAAFLKHMDDRVLNLFDAQGSPVVAAFQVLADSHRQLVSQVMVARADRSQRLSDRAGNPFERESDGGPIALDDRSRGHVRSCPPRTFFSSVMNSSRSLNWRYTEAKRT